MLGDICADLDIELNDAVHCYCDGEALNDHDPDM